MRVLIINTVRFRLNGITSVILNYYRHMDKNEMQIDFVVPNEISSEYKDELEKNGSRIYYIPRKSNPVGYPIRLYNLMKNNHYDLVHIHGNSAMMIFDVLPAKIAGIPVRVVHSHNTTCSHMALHKILLPIFNMCYTHGLACGQDAGKWLYGNRPFIELKNGIDLKQYQFNELIRNKYREKLNVGNRIVIGHIGNFIEQKNHTFLLDWYAELLKQNNNYILLLISDGALLEPMKEKARRLGLDKNVLFLGKTTEVYNYLQAMDIFVLPSLYEGLPVVLVEAQASGLPCIVSDTVAKEANITDSIQFLPINNTTAWVKSVLDNKMADSREDRCIVWQKKLTEAGYDINNNANKMKELYMEYVN